MRACCSRNGRDVLSRQRTTRQAGEVQEAPGVNAPLAGWSCSPLTSVRTTPEEWPEREPHGSRLQREQQEGRRPEPSVDNAPENLGWKSW